MCIQVGYYVGYWNLPQFPHSCTDAALGDKNIYTTLVRVNAAFNKMGKALINIFELFGWSRTVIISTDDGPCDIFSRGVNTVLVEKGIMVAEYIKTPTVNFEMDRGLSDQMIYGYLERIKERGRS